MYCAWKRTRQMLNETATRSAELFSTAQNAGTKGAETAKGLLAQRLGTT